MKTAFKSDDPRVFAAWKEYYERAEQVTEQRLALAQRFGKDQVLVKRAGFGHGTMVVGLPGTRDEEAPEGWRYSPKQRFLVPNLRKKAGKEIVAMMAGLESPGPDLPGMPGFHIGGAENGSLAVHLPALFEHGDVLYCGWDTALSGYEAIEDEHADRVDLSIWRGIPLSEWYSSQEAMEAERSALA